ncbi:hypothetical protein PAUR_a2422 [Pseudoalteromonas aurantia 208]|uniref:Orphan protein n=1 Tax=Pseudoalteromonas aurantia 208 TaxID=1314867 RepID=A0ABR9ECN1_9GAMM|nr:hypothetical protein [Pseudoalteromonas aurantia 208]
MQKQQTNAFWLKALEITISNTGTLILFGHFKMRDLSNTMS